jgi:hypothetical protein
MTVKTRTYAVFSGATRLMGLFVVRADIHGLTELPRKKAVDNRNRMEHKSRMTKRSSERLSKIVFTRVDINSYLKLQSIADAYGVSLAQLFRWTCADVVSGSWIPSQFKDTK